MEWLKDKMGLVGRNRTEGDALESAQERRERWRSVYIIYFTMFQMSLGFSIVLTGVWPYLDKVHKSRIIRLHYIYLEQRNIL